MNNNVGFEKVLLHRLKVDYWVIYSVLISCNKYFYEFQIANKLPGWTGRRYVIAKSEK